MSNNIFEGHLENSSTTRHSIQQIQGYYNKYLIENRSPFLESFFEWLYIEHKIDILKVVIDYSIIDGEQTHGDISSFLAAVENLVSYSTSQGKTCLKMRIGAEIFDLPLLPPCEFDENKVSLISPIISKLMFTLEDQREVIVLGATIEQKEIDTRYTQHISNKSEISSFVAV